MATSKFSDFTTDEIGSVSSHADMLDESLGFSKSNEDKSGGSISIKPRQRLTKEQREKLVVEQAELLAFFTLLYSATALSIAVRLMTKEDEYNEFEKGVSLFTSIA